MPDTRTQLEAALVRGLDQRVQEIVEEEAKAAAERVTRRVKELVPQVSADISRCVEFDHRQDRVLITVRLDDRTTRP